MNLRQRLLGFYHTRKDATAWTLLAPGVLWLVVFFLVPILIMLGYSVMPRGLFTPVKAGFTLEHYQRFFDPLYLQILWRTFA